MNNTETIDEQRMHGAAMSRNTNSKNIFKEPVLYAQFLRDNLDIPILKNVQPEDIEDVSEQYRPYLGIEFESDTVKKIRIRDSSGKPIETPLYLISLTEHKSQVDYNVSMQLLKYMACIWQEYGKEQERKRPGCTKLKSFRYPPILPIVYYEGKEKWTAAVHLKDRIMLNEIFNDCIPDFSYQVVCLHDYDNHELLKRKDEMSLIMLFNKIQDALDLEKFLDIPSEELNNIIKDTPEYILDVIASVMKALCIKIGASNDETDRCIQKVKERRMGYLFENMEKMNIQEERKLRADAQKRLEESEKRLENAEKRLKNAEKILEEEIKLAKEQIAKQVAIQSIVESYKELGMSKEITQNKLIEKFNLTESESIEKMQQYWK